MVEDKPLILLSAIDLVEQTGFSAVMVGNAAVAVRILESRCDVRLLFTDIDMPGSIDGPGDFDACS